MHKNRTELYKYIIMKGNNSEVIKACMEHRPDWEEIPSFSTIFNFKWQPFSRGIKFDLLSINGQKQLVNHFENHCEITTKDRLFTNLKEYSESEVFNYVPLTFLVEAKSDNFYEELDKFRSVYKVLKPFSQHNLEGSEHEQVIEDINDQINNLHWIKVKSNRAAATIKIPPSHYNGYNIWFLKVTQYNRGRGIYVFNDLDKMITLIKELNDGIILSNNNEQESTNTEVVRDKPAASFSNVHNVPNKIKSSTFVIQKYIERPILINERKFDVRVWVLVTQDNKIYFFKEGYLRTS